MRVLIAEDDAITRTTLAENLKKWGYDPVVAEDGEQAWDLLQHKDAPRLVTLDWDLPGLSGIQICRRLRQKKKIRPCYIIMLTGKVTMDNVVAGFEAGADDYVIKPFKGPALRTRILAGARILDMIDQENLGLGETASLGSSLPTTDVDWERGARILIAEDDPVSLTVLTENLIGWGYEVIATENGAEAWEVLKGDDPPQIAVLDWMMPKMTGTEVCRRARERKDQPPIYIVMLTALGEAEDVEAGFEAGVDDYLIKPFTASELRARINVGVRSIEIQARIADRAGQAEADFHAIFHNALEGIYQIKPEGYFITANTALARIYGYSSPADLKAGVTNLAEQVYIDQNRYNEFKRLIERHGQLSHFESQIRRRDGSTAWITESAHAVRHQNGDVLYYEGFISDITDRKKAEEGLRQNLKEITALNTLGQQMSASLSLDQVVESAIDGVVMATNPDLALLFLREDNRLLLKGAGPKSSKYTHGETHVHRVGECLCGLAVTEGKPIYSVNIDNDPRCTWSECKKAGLHSFVALPLRSANRIIGVLGLASGTERDFKEQAPFLETLSNQTAIGLQNALFREEMKRNATKLEERVAERTVELEKKTRDLERFNKLFVGRELRIKELKEKVKELEG